MNNFKQWIIWNKREIVCYFAGMITGPMLWLIGDAVAGLLW